MRAGHGPLMPTIDLVFENMYGPVLAMHVQITCQILVQINGLINMMHQNIEIYSHYFDVVMIMSGRLTLMNQALYFEDRLVKCGF